MIIYLHGFGSSALSLKVQKFKSFFGQKYSFISPNLPTIPKLAIHNIEQLITVVAVKEDIQLVGSSLGGYYAAYFANKYHLKAVLINPAVNPAKTLEPYIHTQCHSYFDNSTFQLTPQHLKDLQQYQVAQYATIENFLLCLKKGDEVLAYTEAETNFSGAKFIIDEGGDHSFANIDKHFPKIEKFLFG